GVLHGDRCGQVGDRVDAGEPALAGLGVADVAPLERPQARTTGEGRQVGLVPLRQVVDREDLVAAIEQLGDDPPADEAGGPGHEHPHRAASSDSTVEAMSAWTSAREIGSVPSERYGPTGAGSAPAYARMTSGRPS